MFDAIINALSALADWIWSLIEPFLTWINDLANDFFELLLAFPEYVFEGICRGFAEFLRELPAPSFVLEAGSIFQHVPPELAFYSRMLEIPFGISVITAALLLRFVLRRIPIIG